MKNTVKKFIGVMLAVIMCLSFLPQTVLAISYPSGVSESDISAVMPKTEKIIKTLIDQNGGTEALKKKLYASFYEDATLNAIFKGVYSALAENEQMLGTLGIDISPAGIAAALKNYPEISETAAFCATLNDVIKQSQYFKWGVKSKASFTSAVAAMFSPMNELLYTLLCGGTYRVGVLISLKGDNGYKNAIVPLLKALECPSIMSQEQYTKLASERRSNMVRSLFDMIFASLDKIIEKPVDGLCTVLPSVAYYLKHDGLSNSLKTLISPLQVKIAGLFSLGGINSIIENSSLLQNSADLTATLGKLDIASAMGISGEIKLAKIDLDAFAACGKQSNGKFTSDKKAAFVTLMRFIIDTAKLNKGSIAQLIPGANAADESITKLFTKPTDEIIGMIVNLFTLSKTSGVLEYSWTYPEFTPGTAEYTPNLTKENYEKVLDELDDTVSEFMKEFTDKGTLSALIGSAVYSNKLLTTLVKKLYGTLEESGAGGFLALLGADASITGVAKAIKSSYPSAAAALTKAGSWNKLNENAVSWGFYNGNRAGFSSALTKVLAPFEPILRFILAEGSISVMDVITVYGGAGYNTAIIPILEALGCNGDLIKTYDEYKRSSGDAVISDITRPIFDLLDRLIAKPIFTATTILPNIVYFLNSDGISVSVQNLLYPVTKLLGSLGLSDVMPDDFINLTKTLNISSLVNTVVSGGALPIKLPEPDLNKAASLGKAVTLASKRTYNGSATEYVYIEADRTAILVTALRYIVNSLKTDENAAFLSDALKNGMGDNEMMSMYTANIGEKLGAMTTDEVIEWLYKLLFSETPKTEPVANDETPPTIIFEAPKKASPLKKGILIGGTIIAMLAVIVFLSRFDFGAFRQRRRHLKNKKKEKKKAARTHSTPAPISEQNLGDISFATGKKAVSEQESLAQFARETEIAERRMAKAASDKNAIEKAKADKEYIKLAIRRDNAARKMEKRSHKADKYYSKALKEAEKKRR